MGTADPAKALRELQPAKKFFIGIDSDGCVFDSMSIKQRECFCPLMIDYFGLKPVAEAAGQCKDFADLFSKTRGENRHKTIVRILTDLLPNHPQVIERGFKVPAFKYYRDWVNDPSSLLSDWGLKKAIEAASDPAAKNELSIALEWSRKVNARVAAIVKGVPPFPYVRECLEKMAAVADIIVVSATPGEALEREWAEHDIAKYARVIAGQEMGSKEQHLAMTAKVKYAHNCSLMTGDAPGDYKAASKNGCLFYPINPSDEIRSWKRLLDEGIERFIDGKFAGDYQAGLLAEFEACLPENPPWKR